MLLIHWRIGKNELTGIFYMHYQHTKFYSVPPRKYSLNHQLCNNLNHVEGRTHAWISRRLHQYKYIELVP